MNSAYGTYSDAGTYYTEARTVYYAMRTEMMEKSIMESAYTFAMMKAFAQWTTGNMYMLCNNEWEGCADRMEEDPELAKLMKKEISHLGGH